MIIKTRNRLILKTKHGPDITAVIDSLENADILYVLLYYYVKSMLEEFDACEVKLGECWRSRAGGGKNFCCGSPTCEHLKKDGCSVMSLGCKLWLCGGSRANYMASLGVERAAKVVNELDHLKRLLREIGLVSFRGERKGDVKRFWIFVDGYSKGKINLTDFNEVGGW